jgi:hypothetical protein
MLAKPPTKRDEARRSFAQFIQAKAGSKVRRSPWRRRKARHSGSTELAEDLDLFVQATAGRLTKPPKAMSALQRWAVPIQLFLQIGGLEWIVSQHIALIEHTAQGISWASLGIEIAL